MLEELKKKVCEANLALVRHGLVTLTWGNASAIDREKGLVVIKPSGVAYSSMTPEDMVAVDLNGNVVEGRYRPSSDTPTHLVLYRAFPSVGGIVHTHSTYATAWAQAARAIPNLGTTHADTFHTDVPLADEISDDRIRAAYEEATGDTIVETFRRLKIDPEETPAALAVHHGPFTWGRTAEKAVENAVVLEEVAKMAAITVALNPSAQMNSALVEKHYSRKHGPNAYYGQRG
ncbi:MAG: L-ribulose-5-phosphate 4-epimerase AraD [Kiritimatiellae bacterium]|nr:L-ribulose-5-phosphate 4-epimerase AraD [Kiritimatiellia bacterium]